MQTTANDVSTIQQRAIEVWNKEILNYVEQHKDNMTARNVLAQRKLSPSVEIDVVTTFDRTGPGAQITAKGAAPDKIGSKASYDYHSMYQIATGFNITAKDMKLDPSLKNRLIDIAMRDIHRAEDAFAIFGEDKLGVKGIVGAAQANGNGKIVASGASGTEVNNSGAWTGEIGTDIYQDVNAAIGLLDGEYEATYLLGNRKSMNCLTRLNPERVPYYKELSGLFGKKNEADKSWMWTNDTIADGVVYVVAKDFMAGEYVVSENPRIVPYALAPGENYPFEVISWSAPEIHVDEAFVEIAIS